MLAAIDTNALLIGLFIGACVGFVIALCLVAVHSIGKNDYAEKND